MPPFETLGSFAFSTADEVVDPSSFCRGSYKLDRLE
jgi:hypothetical protein